MKYIENHNSEIEKEIEKERQTVKNFILDK